MSIFQSYNDLIKLKSIFELQPPPTPEELENLGLIAHPEWAEASWDTHLCHLLHHRGHWERSPRAWDMLKASSYFLSLLPKQEQKYFRQLLAQPVDYQT